MSNKAASMRWLMMGGGWSPARLPGVQFWVDSRDATLLPGSGFTYNNATTASIGTATGGNASITHSGTFAGSTQKASGGTITISGATSSANNGTFTVVNGGVNVLSYNNTARVIETFPTTGTWSTSNSVASIADRKNGYVFSSGADLTKAFQANSIYVAGGKQLLASAVTTAVTSPKWLECTTAGAYTWLQTQGPASFFTYFYLPAASYANVGFLFRNQLMGTTPSQYVYAGYANQTLGRYLRSGTGGTTTWAPAVSLSTGWHSICVTDAGTGAANAVSAYTDGVLSGTDATARTVRNLPTIVNAVVSCIAPGVESLATPNSGGPLFGAMWIAASSVFTAGEVAATHAYAAAQFN